MRAFATTLAFALSLVAGSRAYRVIEPNAVKGWTNDGPQPVVWERVSTDPNNFTILLTNQNRALLSQDLVLMAEQDGTGQSQTRVNPPSAGWPLGSSFRLNLVVDVNNLNSILAQSNEFNITTPTGSITSSTVRPIPTASVPPPLVTTPTTPPTSTGGTPNGSNPGNSGAAATTVYTSLITLLGAAVYLVA